MPFERPTLQQLVDRAETDIKGGLGIVNVLRRSFIAVIARALAGLTHLLYGFLDFIAKQAFPDTAEVEFLERWASIYGVTRNEATFAELNANIVFTGAGTVPANTLAQINGVQYRLDAEVTSPGAGTLSGLWIAVVAGSGGNLTNGSIITLLSPLVNVNSQITITSTSVEGEDTETDESLRARLLNRIQNPPLGGSANDYLQVTLGVPGVTRAWVLPLNQGPGTVDVTFVEDNDNPITPDAPKIQEVQDAIDAFKPVTALVDVFAPVLAPIAMNISIKPNNATIQQSITKQLQDLILSDSNIPGAYKNATETYDGKILLSKITTAIGVTPGLEDFLINTINGNPPADPQAGTGELLTLGVITWQTQP
jgi:uncharacterized phage protein gp47/JayE